MLLAALLLASSPAVAPAQAAPEGPYLTKEEALALAFPACEIERRTIWLTKEERAVANALAGFDVGKSVLYAYVATREDAVVGTGWFDVHQVRTKKEVLFFAVDPGARIRRLELLSFAEPEEYAPRAAWYAQFLGRELDDELRLNRAIKGVTGATLSARATTEAARRVLALHQVAFPPPKKERQDQDGRPEPAGGR